MRITSPSITRILIAFTLLLGAGCAGGHHDSAPVDSGPRYVNPSTTGWSLRKNDGLSSGRHLVLDLVGPSGGAGLGVALNLDLGQDARKADWALVNPSDSDLVKNLSYNLGSGSHAQKAVISGGVLRLGVFCKGTHASPVVYNAPLLSIALNLKEGLPPGDTIVVTPVRADELTSGGVRPITVAIGPIRAK